MTPMQSQNKTFSPAETFPLQPGDLLDEKEAAAIAGLSTTTFRNWRSLKQGPHFLKIGKRAVRYRRSDLEAFFNGGVA